MYRGICPILQIQKELALLEFSWILFHLLFQTSVGKKKNPEQYNLAKCLNSSLDLGTEEPTLVHCIC